MISHTSKHCFYLLLMISMSAIFIRQTASFLLLDSCKTSRHCLHTFQDRLVSQVFVGNAHTRLNSSLKQQMHKSESDTVSPDSSLQYWNRETSKRPSYSIESPIIKTARILSLSDPNDPANNPLHQGSLGQGVELVKIGTCIDDFADVIAAAKQQQHDDLPNTIFVSHPRAREPLAQLLQELPSIEWVHTRSAGIDSVVSPTLENWKGIVTNAKGQFSSTLAEYTLMACSYFAKDLPRLRRQQQAKQWIKYNVLELRGARLGIIGLGDIGRACAKLAAVYGMHITALRRNPRPDPLCDTVYDNSRESLNKIFANSDYILCSAPLTPETRGMIGKEQFEQAKEGSVFINLGRGPIVDEAALIDALKDGSRLKGAALDVFETEPLPTESPLWEMDNVLLSPHNMDQTATFMHEATEFFVEENLPRFIRGEDLLNKVNAAAGY